MKKKFAIIISLIAALVIGTFAFTACGGEEEEPEPPRYEYYSMVYDAELEGLVLSVAHSALLAEGAISVPSSSYYYADEEGGETVRHDEPVDIVALADGGRTFLAEEYESLCVFAFAFFGALIAFFWCNSNPAGIFMGDTGSLAVGGAAACVAVFSQNALFAPIIGIMFVVSCISVILQVLHFKRTKKRLFLMAPFHHHLEYKGIKECKIVSYYAVITLVAAFVALVAYIV